MYICTSEWVAWSVWATDQYKMIEDIELVVILQFRWVSTNGDFHLILIYLSNVQKEFSQSNRDGFLNWGKGFLDWWNGISWKDTDLSHWRSSHISRPNFVAGFLEFPDSLISQTGRIHCNFCKKSRIQLFFWLKGSHFSCNWKSDPVKTFENPENLWIWSSDTETDPEVPCWPITFHSHRQKMSNLK